VSTWDVIVIGCGGIGSAVVRHLAARGARVLGLDRYPIGHDRGSSHGETRVIRQAYFEHPDYVPLLKRAYDLWDALEAETGEALFFRTGVLQAGPPDGEVVRGVRASALAHGLEIDELGASELKRSYPAFRFPEGAVAVLERNAGYLLVEACVHAHVKRARAAGAEVRTGETVTGWRVDGDGVTVTTTSGAHRAGSLVITCGAWSAPIIGDLRVPLTVLRKHLHWHRTSDDRLDQARGCPVFFLELDRRLFYGFPRRDALGVKVSEHSGGEIVHDPDGLSRELDPDDAAAIERFLRDHVPGAAGERTRHEACMYTMSPDGHFLVDVHPEHANVVFAAGLSGHGFKFAPALGEALADLALGGRSDGVGFLATGRFG